ncbi:hypothetical protein HanIR_Chr12g0615851 [Helianthus annuus]|nr:hypothetical protein HanIR_Chr12g0615851 [Helianthus annuus]
MQRACTTSGDHGKATSLPTLWDSLPSIDVVGGQFIPSFILLFSFSFLLISSHTQIYIFNFAL